MDFTRAQLVAMRAILRSKTAVLSARRGARLAEPLAELERLAVVERWRPSRQVTAREKSEYEGAWTLTPYGAFHARRWLDERWEFETQAREELERYERKGPYLTEIVKIVKFRAAIETTRWEAPSEPDPDHPDHPDQTDPRGRVLTPPARLEVHRMPKWMDLPDPAPGPEEQAEAAEEFVRVAVVDETGAPKRDPETGASVLETLVVMGKKVRRDRRIKGKRA